MRERKLAFTLIELLVVIEIIVILAAFLFPVFAQVRGKGWQATCLSNLKQIGSAMAMYVQDYDEHIPNCCGFGRASVWVFRGADFTAICGQVGITRTTPKDMVLGPEQTPPRYVQELLHPYVKNAQIWFCPGVAKDHHWTGDPGAPTFGFNGTSYFWIDWADPTRVPNPFSKRQPIQVSGRAVAAIPRPAEAQVLWDLPHANPIKEPCTSMSPEKPAHAKGVNVLYADSHAKYRPFLNRPTPGLDPPCSENWYFDHNWEGYFE